MNAPVSIGPATPVLPGGPAAAGDEQGTGGFPALVAGLVEQLLGGPAATPAATGAVIPAATGTPTAVVADPDARASVGAADPEDASADETAVPGDAATAVAAWFGVVAPTNPTPATPGATGAASVGDAGVTMVSNAPAAPATPSTPPASADRDPGTDGEPSHPGSAHTRADAAQPGGPADAPSSAGPSTHDSAGPAGQPAAPQATSPAPTAAPDAVPTAAPDAPVAVLGTAAVSAPATVTAPAGTAQPAPVPRQVFPEVVRVATTPGGPQRVTIKLQPEALGEVRVVLTSHRGELRVSLGAEAHAHHALLEGAPELRRLLEAAGVAEARIVVRDLPGSGSTGSGGPSQTGTQTGTQTGPQTGTDGRQDADRSGQGALGQPGAGGSGSGDGRAPMYGRSTATDGTPGATTPSRRTETVTRARAAGLDVTM